MFANPFPTNQIRKNKLHSQSSNPRNFWQEDSRLNLKSLVLVVYSTSEDGARDFVYPGRFRQYAVHAISANPLSLVDLAVHRRKLIQGRRIWGRIDGCVVCCVLKMFMLRMIKGLDYLFFSDQYRQFWDNCLQLVIMPVNLRNWCFISIKNNNILYVFICTLKTVTQ